MRIMIALISGALFGLGLVVSDMIDPARVIAFLDVSGGAWDPTLAFVMGGALIPMMIAWRVAAVRSTPQFGTSFPDPKSDIDKRLLGGATLFGAGWGLVGFCPGPALSALTLGGVPTLIFVVSMLVGMAIHGFAFSRPKSSGESTVPT